MQEVIVVGIISVCVAISIIIGYKAYLRITSRTPYQELTDV